jgi:hypothetical protein
MANEFHFSLEVKWDDPATGISIGKAFGLLKEDRSGQSPFYNAQNVGTTEEALLLGDAGQACTIVAINRSTANYVQIRVGTGGSDFARLLPGQVCMVPLDPIDAAAPFAIANSQAVVLEYWLFPA